MLRKIRDIIYDIRNAEITRVFSSSAGAAVFRLAVGLIITKAVSSAAGPEGVALAGQLGGFASVVFALSGAGINNGVVKYIAQYGKDLGKSRELISTAFRITLYCSLACGILLAVFHKPLAEKVMLTREYGYLFIILGAAIAFYAVSNLLLSIINGYKEYRKYIRISVISSVLNLIISLSLIRLAGLKGALIAAVTVQSMIIIATVSIVYKEKWFAKNYFNKKINPAVAGNYFHYTLMAVVSAAAVPLTQLILRRYVMSGISVVEAGWWEAVSRLSGAYLMAITTSFSVYYLPKLSESLDKSSLRQEILKAYKFIIPVMVLCLPLIYIARVPLIRILYTPDFIPMEEYMPWQLAGDFFKIAGWILGFVIIAKRKTFLFIVYETACLSAYLLLSFILMKINGTVGLVQSYFITYVIAFISISVIFRKFIFTHEE